MRLAAGFLVELSPGGGERVLVNGQLALGNCPRAQILPAPERAAGVHEQHFELAAGGAVHQETGADLRHLSWCYDTVMAGRMRGYFRGVPAASRKTGMQTLRTVQDIRRALDASRRGRQGAEQGLALVGLVPTMGALHDGHVALIRAARAECQIVVASLFVNPPQFNDPRDLAAYPRDEQRDARMANGAGVDYLFAPTNEEMYPPGYATWIDMGGPARGLEGDFRPGHFRGVATVCLKLFTIVRPHRAYFGQKDAQQVAVVKRMARDLNLDVEIRVVPTVREADGLVLSSRNVHLSPAERERALAIVRALDAGLRAHRAGRDPVAAARAALTDVEVEYVAVAEFEGQPTLAIAARIGRTRLIDNIPLDAESV